MNFEEAIKQVSLYEKNKFPTEAVEYIGSNKDLFEKKFIEILKNYANDSKLYELKKDDYVSSLLFLSQFQSKEAFPVLLDLLKTLPYSDEMDQPFGDMITEIVPPALAACFNGDLEITLDLLCSKDSYLFARLAVLSMLEICIFTEKLTEQEVLDFYDKIVERLYTQDKEDEFLQDCMDELAGISFPKMETTLIKYSITLNEEKKIEINYLRKKDNRYYLTDKDRSMKSYNDLITNGMRIIKTWNMFTPDQESTLHSYDFENEDFFISDERIQPKIGRNNPCPCGSGKKFKKCCLH